MRKNKKWEEWLWDAWCVVSVVGIWPRFIEPNLLTLSKIPVTISKLPPSFDGFKILQLSDLHWDAKFSPLLLRQLHTKIKKLKPNLIVFTGDLICRSKMEDRASLKTFLSSLKSELGCYAVLGNHDYAHYITLNKEGDYDIDKPVAEADINKGFRRLFSTLTLTKKATKEAQQVDFNQDVLKLFKETSIQLLNNETKQLTFNGAQINLCGLEDYMCKRFNPKMAFENYNVDLPGIILSHNPDSVYKLQNYPGDLILSGHTHGGEINLPFMWKKFCLMENPSLKSGLKWVGNKWIYINRGITSIMKFRWFALPELTLITLKTEKK